MTNKERLAQQYIPIKWLVANIPRGFSIEWGQTEFSVNINGERVDTWTILPLHEDFRYDLMDALKTFEEK